MKHVPVMLREVIDALSPKGGEVYIDGTFGAGGYARAILAAAKNQLIGLDRDPNVRPFVRSIQSEFGDRFRFVETAFSELDSVAAPGSVDGVVLDIGVSSMQIDEAVRGFSFQSEGPLDMRMSGQGVSAANAIKYLSRNDLERIFKVYGEERHARRCADFIVRSREGGEITTTSQLAAILEKALGRAGKRHPATRVFQALRIFINDELSELSRALMAAERVLKPGGRLVVVTFHSLEDRIVKNFLRTRAGKRAGGSRYAPPVADMNPPASFTLPKHWDKAPSEQEVDANPRARSARLRLAVRTEACAWDAPFEPARQLPTLGDLERLVS